MKPIGNTLRLAACLLLSLAFLQVGCAERGGTGVSSAPPAPKLGPDPTKAQAEKFAADFRQAVEKGDVAAVNSLIDWDTLLATTIAGIEVSKEFREGFLRGIKSELGSDHSFAGQLIGNIGKGGNIRLLRIHKVDGRSRALFRMLAEDGMNYIDFVLVGTDGPAARAVDFYSIQAGDLMSGIFRGFYLQAVGTQPKNFLERLTSHQQESALAGVEIGKLAEDLRDKRYEEGLERYEKLPESVKKLKATQLMRVAIARQLNEKSFIEAIEDYQDAFPDDASVDLLSMDYYVVTKRYDDALASIDRLDKVVQDPQLDVGRANVYVEKGDLADARKSIDRAIQREPDLLMAYWTRVAITMAQKDFAATAADLTLLHDRFGIQFADLTKAEPYAEFAKSPEYEKWMKSLTPAKPQDPKK
jgi:tetratricopeptide (TPR) repeat protein